MHPPLGLEFMQGKGNFQANATEAKLFMRRVMGSLLSMQLRQKLSF